MKMRLTAVAFAIAVVFATDVPAQASKTYQAQPVEGVVTVTNVDRAARTVTVRGAKGNDTVVSVPPEAQNLDQVQVGSRFKVRFLEEIAVGVSPGGEPSAVAGSSVQMAPKGGTPGGTISKIVQVNSVVEAVDPASRQITLRGPLGDSRTMRVAEDVKLGGIKPGDSVTVSHTQALATHMISSPQPVSDPAPAP
jgi:Cu/Ag efflux protein CusF